MQLSGGVKQGSHRDRTLEIAQVIALTTVGPSVSVLADAEFPISAPALGNPH